MEIEISIGEIIDKLTILSIKKERIIDSVKLKNVEKEFIHLSKIVKELNVEQNDISDLLEVNLQLWEIEDNIREKERNKTFDSDFIELARKVYIKNDLRASIKRKINEKYFSNFTEEKSYSEY
jgi:hypothetical protein